MCRERGLRSHLLALAFFAGFALLLFRLSVFEGWTFIGDSDRLNTFLNIRVFEADSIRERGTVSTWNEQQFMGFGMAGLHWMLPGVSPFPYLVALFPPSETIRVSNVITMGLLVAACWSAYFALRAYTAGPLAAAIGGLLYGTSAYAIHRVAQVDASFSVLIVLPLILIGIRETRRSTALVAYSGLVACWASLFLFTFLQEVAYAALFFGAYTMYRAVRMRDLWPLVISGLAFASALVIGLPRLLTVATDFGELARSSIDFQWTVAEAFRFFADGLVGRTQSEQVLLRAPLLNLHEGAQLLDSPAAALAVLAAGLFARSWVMRAWGAALVAVLSVVLVIWFRPFYDLLGRPDFPTRELRVVLMNAILIGLPLWLLCSWLVARRGGQKASTTVEALTDDTLAAKADGPFFFGFVVLALATILITEAHVALYYLFLRVDFQHARISSAMLLPLAALASVFLSRYLPARLEFSTVRWLVGGAALGAVLWFAREAIAETVVSQFGPSIEFLRPRRLLTVEGVRVVGSLALLLVALGVSTLRARPAIMTLTGGVLAIWMVLETGATAELKLNGPHTRDQAFPFETFNYLTARPGQFRVPTAAERAALRARLETDQYRVVLRQDRTQFMAHIEPHLGTFWDLRLIEGYGAGMPRRLTLMPFGEGTASPHDLDLGTNSGIPWQLLAALNVKYVVSVDQSLWYNPAPGGNVAPIDVQKLTIEENPYPVAPRVFFAARLSPAGNPPRLPGDTGERPPPADPPIQDVSTHSVVEGRRAEQTFSTAGTIDASFHGDWVSVRVEPSAEERFLVLNERYYPGWRATIDGYPTEIYPTNLVMRGLLVPAGATSVELRYVPFIMSGLGLSLLASGLLLTGVVWCGLRYVVRRQAPGGPGPCQAVSE
jgi:hypothetical protein